MLMPPIERDVTVDLSDRARQHWVSDAYLRQWCDPTTPQGAYLWVSPKDRSRPPVRRSPKKTFTSAEMYTMVKGNLRNLRLESLFHSVETSFGAARASIVSGARPSGCDLDAVGDFMAAQIIRTPKFRDAWRFSAQADHDAKLADLKDEEARLGLERTLAVLWTNQSQLLCLVAYPKVVELLRQMRVRLYKAPEPRSFITSDAPCCVIDYSDTAGSVLDCLSSQTVNVMMPVSPDVVAILDRSDEPHEMAQLFPGHEVVARVNSMLREGAANEIVLPGSAVLTPDFDAEHSEQLRRYVVR